MGFARQHAMVCKSVHSATTLASTASPSHAAAGVATSYGCITQPHHTACTFPSVRQQLLVARWRIGGCAGLCVAGRNCCPTCRRCPEVCFCQCWCCTRAASWRWLAAARSCPLMPPASTLLLLSACTTVDSYSTVCYDVALGSLHVHGEHVVSSVYTAHGVLSYSSMVAPSVEACPFPGRLPVFLGQVTAAAGFARFLKLQLPLSLLGATASGHYHGGMPLLTMVSCSAPQCT
jgi:hypothetical protein